MSFFDKNIHMNGAGTTYQAILDHGRDRDVKFLYGGLRRRCGKIQLHLRK